MALSTLEQDTISRAVAAAKIVVDQLKPLLDGLDIIYNSAGGAKTTIDQAGLAGIASFSGLTKQQLDDAMFVLTGALRADIVNAYTQLVQLSSRNRPS